MIDAVKVASYVCKRYKEDQKKDIDEMKLHKLLYFIQRECLIQTGQPMFEEPFSAWKYGPVMVGIRQLYKNDQLHTSLSETEIDEYKSVFDKVFEQYAPKSSLSLSSLSHNEYSWIHARGTAKHDEHCDTYLDIHDIKKDAERIKTRRFMLKVLRKIEEREAMA